MRYLQLTHNEWDAATKTSRPKVLHSFGREDQLDRDAIRRLVGLLTRLLDPNTALTLSDTSTGHLPLGPGIRADTPRYRWSASKNGTGTGTTTAAEVFGQRS